MVAPLTAAIDAYRQTTERQVDQLVTQAMQLGRLRADMAALRATRMLTARRGGPEPGCAPRTLSGRWSRTVGALSHYASEAGSNSSSPYQREASHAAALASALPPLLTRIIPAAMLSIVPPGVPAPPPPRRPPQAHQPAQRS
jgi:hypothetical protein